MDEINPLSLSHSKPETNRRGRPTNDIKFGPQPNSLVSQMLQKIKAENCNLAISLDSINKTRKNSIILLNSVLHDSSIQIDLDSDVNDTEAMKRMNDNNPLSLSKSKLCASDTNRRGRPTNKNTIKFGPQPNSLVSQMLQKVTAENGDLAISFDALDKTKDKHINLENSDEHSSHIEIDPDPDENDTEVMNKSKDRKYPCDFPNCTYACKFSSNLIKHKRTHTSEKPYLCHLCSFRSNFINSLKVHQRIHTAERPYSCNYCEYRCNSSSNLKKHCKHRHSIVSIQEGKSKQINKVNSIK